MHVKIRKRIGNPTLYNAKINYSHFVSKSKKHNDGTIYIQLFTLYRAAVDVILRLLFFVCQGTGEENFRKLSSLPADNGYRTAVACRQLFGTFLFRNKVHKCQCGHMMNLSTYFLCYYLFSSAMITLLDRFYITRKRSWTHIILWMIFSSLSGVVLLLLPGGAVQNVALLALATWLVIYGLMLARRVIVAYRRAVRIFDDTHADDIGAYIEWLSIFTYWALIFGVGCGLLTFLPDEYVYIWILSSIPFYSYLFYSYQNYLLFYEQVENAFEQDIQSEEELLTDTETEPEIVPEQEVPMSYIEIIEKVDNWIKTDGYVQQGLTIKGLSEILHTNRTYLSAYIKTAYKMTFREWITALRLEYAKNILKEHPEINIQKLAESSGFLSRSNFIKSFTEKEGCTPAKWKKANLE